jgi:hypothetical protein
MIRRREFLKQAAIAATYVSASGIFLDCGGPSKGGKVPNIIFIMTDDSEQDNIGFTKPISHGPATLGFDYFFGTSGCTTDDPPICFIENNRTVGIPDRITGVDPADEGRELIAVEGWRHEEADFEFGSKSMAFTERQARTPG